MAARSVPEIPLLPALNPLGPYVVLRNHDVLAHVASGADIDLLVSIRGKQNDSSSEYRVRRSSSLAFHI